MKATIRQSPLDDFICVWLDDAIPILEKLDFLRWSAEKDISIPEALRARLFQAIKRYIEFGHQTNKPQRKIDRFPSSVISRVQNAISHLSGRRNEDELRPRNIVFIPQTVAQLAQQVPVAKALEENGKSYCFLFQSRTWGDKIDLGDLDVNIHSKVLQCELLSARLRARVFWLRLGREESLPLPEFDYDQRKFDLNRVVLDTILDSIACCFEAHALSKYMIDFIRPKLIVVGNDLTPLGRVITACAKRYGIRSVALLTEVHDGPIDAYHTSDRFVVFGNYGKRVLTGAGIDTKRIKACGAPYLDVAHEREPRSFLSKVGGAKNHAFVLADLPSGHASIIRKIASERTEMFFLFLSDKKAMAPLSAQKIRNYRTFLKAELSSSKYAACLKSADLILTARFKTAIEALSLGKNVIAINFDGQFDDPTFLMAQVVPCASDEISLRNILNSGGATSEEILQLDSRRKFLEDQFYRRDGQSSQRIARVITEECQR